MKGATRAARRPSASAAQRRPGQNLPRDEGRDTRRWCTPRSRAQTLPGMHPGTRLRAWQSPSVRAPPRSVPPLAASPAAYQSMAAHRHPQPARSVPTGEAERSRSQTNSNHARVDSGSPERPRASGGRRQNLHPRCNEHPRACPTAPAECGLHVSSQMPIDDRTLSAVVTTVRCRRLGCRSYQRPPYGYASLRSSRAGDGGISWGTAGAPAGSFPRGLAWRRLRTEVVNRQLAKGGAGREPGRPSS